MSASFPYSEAKLCERIGISRDDRKEFRDSLAANVDWKKIGGEVALSARGLRRLWKRLRQRPAELDLLQCLIGHEKNGAISSGTNGAAKPILLGHSLAPIPLAVTITHICPNPALIFVADDSMHRMTVWVGRNALFTTGMKIEIAAMPQQPGYWRMLGTPPQRAYSAAEWTRRQRAGIKG